jgi:hypothetical protein
MLALAQHQQGAAQVILEDDRQYNRCGEDNDINNTNKGSKATQAGNQGKNHQYPHHPQQAQGNVTPDQQGEEIDQGSQNNAVTDVR